MIWTLSWASSKRNSLGFWNLDTQRSLSSIPLSSLHVHIDRYKHVDKVGHLATQWGEDNNNSGYFLKFLVKDKISLEKAIKIGKKTKVLFILIFCKTHKEHISPDFHDSCFKMGFYFNMYFVKPILLHMLEIHRMD